MLRRLILSVLTVLCLGTAVFAQSAISELTADCAVDEKGRCTVTTEVVLQLEESVAELSLPVGQGVSDAACRGYEAEVRKEDDFVWLDLTFPAPVTGQQTFTITYTIPATVTAQDDGTQLFSVELLSSQWAYPVEKFQYLLSMPKDFTAEPVLVSGYYGEIAPNQLVTNQNARSAAAVLSVPLLDHESVSLQLSLPADYFSLAGPVFGSGFPWQLLPPILLLLAAIYWFFLLRTPLPHRHTAPQPPDGITAGELPTLLWGGPPDFALTVANWGSLGYLAAAPHKHGKFALMRRMSMGNERRGAERRLFERLFSQADACYCTDPQAQAAAHTAEAGFSRHWRRRLFDPRSGAPAVLDLLCILAGTVAGGRILTAYLGSVLTPLIWAALGAVLGAMLSLAFLRALRALFRGTGRAGLGLGAGIVLLLTGGFAGLGPDTVLVLIHIALTAFLTAYGGRRTALGTELLQKTLDYRRYLAGLDEMTLRRLVRQNPQFYYETLPFAEALGLGEQLTERLHGVQMESCAWMGGTTSAGAFYQRFCALSDQLDEPPATPAKSRGRTRQGAAVRS